MFHGEHVQGARNPIGKIIAVGNQKGGVGKTTTVVNLACAVAQLGRQVLVVDFDPQANATSGLGVDKRTVTPSVYEGLMGHIPLADLIRPTEIPNLSLIPSHANLSGAEVELVQQTSREFKLREALALIKDRYEWILVDCPPSLGFLTLNALVAADGLLIPLQCEYYALEGLSQLVETLQMVQRSLNAQLAIHGVVLTMADQRTRLTADVINEVRTFFKDRVYQTVIPRSVRLSEAPSYGKPVALYAPSSIGAQRYAQLAREFVGLSIPEISSVIQESVDSIPEITASD